MEPAAPTAAPLLSGRAATAARRPHASPAPGGLWEGGVFPVTLSFTEDYPTASPKASFPAGFFHPNVFGSGVVCLNILKTDSGWRPGITVKQILLGIQDLLETPNNGDAANAQAHHLFHNPAKYITRVKEEVRKYTPGSA